MIKAGIIGISGFGAVHYEDLLRLSARGRLQPLGAVVINPDQEHKKCEVLKSLGCEIFPSHPAMFEALKGRLELCFIPTGIPLHAPMAIAAMRSGASVFMEKPAAASIQDVRAMQACEKETGRFVAIGYQHFYGPEIPWIKGVLASGRLGKIQAIKCRALWPRLDDYYSRNAWAGRLKTAQGDWVLDSPFNNALAHPLNLMCHFAGGRVQRVQAELYKAHAIESPDTVAIRARVGGIPVFFFASHACEGYLDPEIIVRGEKGSLTWDFQGARLEGEERQALGFEPLRDAMLERVLARLAGPGPEICCLEIAGAQTLVCNGAHESSSVHAIPEVQLRRSPSEGSFKTVVDGVDELILRAYREENLFSELGAPWARPGQDVDLASYEEFPRRKEPL